MSIRHDIWLSAHLSLAADMEVTIGGNGYCAASVLGTLMALCPEFKGTKPTREMLEQFSLKEYGWTPEDFNEYVMDDYE
jgi:hypothetical protein